ncbi:3-oxoacyl-[acyl-carrier-protein] synthase III C-terminal domain-containing protein [Pseudonocardia sp. TRM90224]|uniref:3-oxoacyl-[acyl-carrier-protein] synthase III C-terminal domain-containing protein n=1 Tax=Pseudonocardia sp. TRM90224 TaxID=2812678 RepID=UPI001E5369BF|nr:3-oxoacyl-[acyl-carrier-protein] synthase III C-terminal domain-containing protein [Pseudonocardia sp. TRM90224]
MTVDGLCIEAVDAFVPAGSATIEEIGAELGLSRAKVRLFRRMHGVERVHRAPGLGVLDLVAKPAAGLVADPAVASRVRYLIYAHTMQDVAPFGVSIAAQLRTRLGLPAATAFALTQQYCASGLAAVATAGELLALDAVPDALALVVTGELAFSPMSRLIPNTAVMGEVAAACLVGLSGSGDAVRSHVVQTDGRYAGCLRLSPQDAQDFAADYPKRLADVMASAVSAAGLTMAEIDRIVPHNVNRSSWRRTLDVLGIDAAQVFLDNIAESGHCFCADPFLNYTTMRNRGLLRAGGHYLLTAVGLGATYVATVVRHGGAT